MPEPSERLPPEIQYFSLKSALLTTAFAAILIGLFIARSPSELVIRSSLSMMVAVGISVAVAVNTARSRTMMLCKFGSLVTNFLLFVSAIWTLCQLRLSKEADYAQGFASAMGETFPFQFFMGICAAGLAWAIYYLASVNESLDEE